MVSKDGGENWSAFDNSRMLTAMNVLPNGNDIIAYSINKNKSGLVISQDGDRSWRDLGLDLGIDAVTFISVNPNDEKQIAVASRDSDSVYETRDGGEKWKKIISFGKLN